MFPAAVSTNSTSLSEETSVSSATRVHDFGAGLNSLVPTTSSHQQPQKIKKKRSLPGNPDPDAEVIALSPKTLLTTNRFVCEICNKGFQRDQNLQLHRRGHNLPWKLKQRNGKEVKKRAYVCPEPSCVHHNPARALGDLTGIKKHYCRKHGEKKWKCDKCSKIYAVQSDWKAHSKTCGTREYRCDCGTHFSRKDSFITHRAFCDALAEESARLSANQLATTNQNPNPLSLHSLLLFPTQQNLNPSWDSSQQNPNPLSLHSLLLFPTQQNLNPSWDSSQQNPNPNPSFGAHHFQIKHEAQHFHVPTLSSSPSLLHEEPQHHKTMIDSPFQELHVSAQPASNAAMSPHLSATALLQKAATVGATAITGPAPAVVGVGHVTHQTQFGMADFGTVSQLDSAGQVLGVPEYMRGFATRNLKTDRLTRDFLGLNGGNGGNAPSNGVNMFTFTAGVDYRQPYEHQHQSLYNSQQNFGFAGTAAAPRTWGNY